MAKAPAGNGTTIKNSTSACPNLGSAAHTSSSSAGGSYLTKAQVRAAIAAIDTRANSKLMRVARFRAFTAGIDADDLLQEAILRALTSRSCPIELKIEHFLMAVMRSIASAVIAKRERDEGPYREAFEQLTPPCAPDKAYEIAVRAEACRKAIEDVAGSSPKTEAVIDGIDQGLCGKALANFAGVEQAELATVRRLIKRRAAKFWNGYEDLDFAA
ncbi:sigma-70 family RNA polymerase sigma factor [Qipengyuania flava]|uniref:sigma-70 family RNA polymerase sigma factor n=1 Tax=Qipengyuania flava TaxID=192812 RepID=UPI00141B9617|nr:sigma-70 family RNA polymerase sigma factor [Qipengyuania flava]NIJ61140.1 DNA-directed RNA polymerase specialized sigma24 family protein [Qipengyuania flava]